MADASASLQALLSTKAALDLGLVTPADYDAVKRAFLAAQQIRAAVDAGLVAEGDYEATKARYLAELLAQGGGLGGGGSEAAAAAAPAANGAPRAAAPPQPPAPRAAAPPPPPAPRAPAPPAPPAPPPPQPAAAPPPQPAAPPPQQQPAAGVPANLPRVGGAKPVGAGTSMSGIRLTEDAVNLFYLIRSKSAYQWATWRVDDSGAAVVIAAVGAPGAPYADFLAALPEDDCRYGVFDYCAAAADGAPLSKLVFFNWAPDAARVKAKMMYASTKDFFKGHLDGVSAEFQASEREEVAEAEVAEAVRALKRG